MDSFEAFDSFPWLKHRAFLLGLIETLGGAAALSSPSPTHKGSCAFCRTVYYKRQTGVQVDLIRYGTFVASNPDPSSRPSVDERLLEALYRARREIVGQNNAAAAAADPTSAASGIDAILPANINRQIAEAVAASAATATATATATAPAVATPSWQHNAPKKELVVKQDTSAGSNTGGGGGGGGPDAPYPDKFAQVVEALQSGKPVEGIRQIPDTVVRQPGITPVGKMRAPRKPWETTSSLSSLPSSSSSPYGPGGSSTSGTGTGTADAAEAVSVVDKEFPPPPPSAGEAEGEEGDAPATTSGHGEAVAAE